MITTANTMGHLDWRSIRGGASALAMVTAGLLAAPALAQQAQPGSAQCPIVNGVVTCTGDIRSGFVAVNNPTLRELIVRDLTQPINTTYFAIGVTQRSANDLVVNIAPDVVITTNDNLGDNTLAQGIILIADGGSVAAPNDVDIALTTGARITANSAGFIAVGIEVDSTNGNGDISIANSGAISATSGGTGERDEVTAGILTQRFNTGGLTTINNTGAITITTGAATFDTNFAGVASAIVANDTSALGRIVINNNAALTANGPDAGGITAFVASGVAANRSTVQITSAGTIATTGGTAAIVSPAQATYGILAQSGGELSDLAVVNDSVITMTRANAATGIFALTQSRNSAVSVTNRAAINGTSTTVTRGIGVSSSQALAGGTYDFDLINSGAITINAPRADGLTLFWTREDTADLTIRNAGNIDLTNTTSVFSNGILAAEGLPPTGNTALGTSTLLIVNSGNVAMGTGQAVFANATNLTLTNSGVLTTTGNPDAQGNAANVVDIEGLTRGTTGGTVNFSTTANITASGVAADGVRVTNGGVSTLTVAAGATVTSGSSAAAAALRTGGAGGTTLLTNAGTLTSTGGTGVLGTAGPVLTIENSGRIAGGAAAVNSAGRTVLNNRSGGAVAGAVTLGAGDDAVTGFAGSTMSGALATGAGADTVTFASGVFSGAIALGDGADALVLNGRNPGIAGVDGGAGDDLVRFAGTESYTVDLATTPFTGIERFAKVDAATLTLTGTAPTTGTFTVSGGSLVANSTTTALGFAVESGGVLAGTGSIGATTASAGTITPGSTSAGTLTVNSLGLTAASTLLFNLGTAGAVGGATNDLLVVTGALVLDGSLDITTAPTFGDGVYRLINYGGALTDNGLVVRTGPAGSSIQTAVAGQVNLIVGTSPIQFWDGGGAPNDNVVAGGSGTWNAANANWTNAAGNANAPWASNMGVFGGTAGTVTVEGAQATTGLQFVTGGYTLTGGQIVLSAAATPVRTDAGVTATVNSAIGGTGALSKRDAGTLVLGGTNTYGGGTQVLGGVVQISGDTALGATAGNVTLDGGTLRAGAALSSARTLVIGAGGGTLDTGANAVALSGVLGGAGLLTKTGTGTLALSGASGLRTGATTVAAGTLDLTVSLGGALTIANGATLTGTGTAGSLTVAGTVAPTGTGTLTVTGNVTFAAGSTYNVGVAASGAGDRINAGTATLNGGTVAVTALDPELNYASGSVFRILNATGGRTGTFAGLTESSAFLDFALGYDATSAFLTTTVLRQFPAVAATFNQAQASTGLAAFDRTAGSDSLGVFNAILLLDAAPARAAFDSASGEIHASVGAASAQHALALSDQLTARANIVAQPGWSLWAAGQLNDGSLDGDGNAGQVQLNGYGGLAGVDYRRDNLVVGAAVGYGDADVALDARGSTADSDHWTAAVYARLGTGGRGFTATATAGLGSAEVSTVRSIAFGTISRVATAAYDVDTTFAAGEVRFGVGSTKSDISFGPLASIAYVDVDGDAFTERGADALNLSGAGTGFDRTRYGGGAFARAVTSGGWLEASAQYVTSGRDAATSRHAFAGASTSGFVVLAPGGRGDGGLFALAGETSLGRGLSIGGGAQYHAGRNGDAVNGTATLRLAF